MVNFNPDVLELSLNSMNSQITREQLKKTTKMIMYSVVEQSDKTTNFADDEKFLIGIMAYDKIVGFIDSKKEIPTTMEVFVNSFVSFASDLYLRQRITDSAKMKAMLRIIDNKDYKLEDLPDIGDDHIRQVLSTTIDVRFDQAYTDEVFAMTMFMTEDNVILSANKITNIRKLYDTVIYPILMYYKMKSNQAGVNLLSIVSGLSNSNKLQQRGQAVIFNLNGIEASAILRDIKQNRIHVSFGVVRRDPTGLFISLPYTTDEGKYIENQIDE